MTPDELQQWMIAPTFEAGPPSYAEVIRFLEGAKLPGMVAWVEYMVGRHQNEMWALRDELDKRAR